MRNATWLTVPFAALMMVTAPMASHASMHRVAYLSDDTIYVVSWQGDAPAVHEETVWMLPRRAQRATYSGLSCGPAGTLLLHVTRLGSSPPEHAARAVIALADVSKRTLADMQVGAALSLTWPKLSPNGSWVAASAVVDGKSALALVAPGSGDTRVFLYPGIGSPQTWSPVGDKLFLTGLDAGGHGWQVIEFDVASEQFRRLPYAGGRPTASPSGDRLAYLANDQKNIIVVDPTGTPTLQLSGFFKDIIGWLDESRLLYVTGVMYRDRLGVGDLSSGHMQVLHLRSTGEINGACILA